ncbi:MAG: tRNA uridine-5-carboxymethylaminomethyl(34) synthesis GTPase MnmE [Prevotellaceae bacterium]|nr:tRNA uridine-5-carboxymethylaminomethyl(34) synthesis GTPase MnmE [Prevotellaceae bacterium]MDY3365353.1 tRNA uridine-5-carboxymethylaminomethyl(34) synthesis GTPase MnmE [Prevotella sp.]
MVLTSTNTICALSTPAGGAIGVIRISGSDAIVIAERIFVSNSRKVLPESKAQTLHYGRIVNPQSKEVIDDVIIALFKAPHSYTGENSVEISCHGSRYIISKLLELLIKEGCVQAQPGEFTMRAFMNGKMDLSQAEAVADLIASTNQASHKMAISQLRGNFSNELGALRNELLNITSLLELEMDFSDHEELEFANRTELLELAQKIDTKIVSLFRSFETGRAIKQGVPVAIVGKTNVGKSTLLNSLLHEDKAIVSDIHGTTRDVIEDTIDIHGITFRFIDTAGIRSTTDEIETLGIERTYQKMNEAQIIIWLMDTAPEAEEEEIMHQHFADKRVIQVYNKADLQNTKRKANGIVSLSTSSPLHISAKMGINITELEEAIYQAANIPEITENDVIITNIRHYEALTKAHDSISRVIEGLQTQLSSDLLSEELRICLEQLADITGGQITTPEVLQNIFKHFCIGK